MANHPHHDDDQSKKTPGSGATPKRPIPNMSLDDDEPFVVEEVVEAEVIPLEEAAPEDALPIVEAAPESDIIAAEVYEDEAAAVLAEDEVVEEIAEAMPASDVLLSMEQAPAAQAETPEPHAHLAHPASDVKPGAPASEVNLAELFGTAYAPPVDEGAAVQPPDVESAPAQEIAAAAPESHDPFDWRHPVAEEIGTAPASDIHVAEEAAEVVEEVAEAEPVSEVVVAEEVLEEVAEAEPVSEVVEAEEVAEAAPASAVIVADEVAEAEPISEVVEAEEVAEAEPISEVVEAEEFVEAADASDVLAAEAVADISIPSEIKSGVLADDVVEEVVEEIEEAEPASAVAMQEDDITEFADAPALLKAHDSAVLAAEPVHSGSSAVLFDEVGEDIGHKKSPGTAEFDKTVAFGTSSSSAKKKAEPDSLVTEEEVIGEAEPASAVNLAEGSGRKSSATGIDEVAEALESGVGLDSSELANTALPEPSVEFDEILDEEETAPKSSKKKKAKFIAEEDEAEAAEAAEDEDAEIFDSDDEPVSSVRMARGKAKATGDDIDLDDIFSEAEATEAVDADEAVGAEAEADEAYAEAGADDDAAKKFQGEDEAEAVDADADEDVSAKKKKGKDKKDKATVAAPSKGSSAALVWAGRLFLVFVGMILVSPLFFFLTPEAPKQVVVPPPPKVDARTPLDKYRDALAKGEYETLTKDLETATDEAELDVRGQARWFAYAKQQADKKAPLDRAAPEIKAAKEDLDKAKNVAMIAQIDAVLNGGDGGELAKLKKLETMLRADKAKTDKVLDSVAEVLVKGDYLKDKNMFSAAMLEKIMQSLSDDRTSLEALNKILTDAKYKDGEEGLKSVLKEKKAAEDGVVAINKVLDDEKTKDKGAKGVLEIVVARNKASADLTGVAKDRDDVLALVKRAYDELGGADKADPRKELMKAIQQARVKAESPLTTPLAQLGMSLGNIATGTSKTVEQTFALSKVFAELGFFRTREAFIDTPQQKMDLYIMLLQDRKENNARTLAAIITEAAWVLTPDAKSTPEQQAKARYVQGLALRNQEKFSEAKIAFADALKRGPFDDTSAWTKFAAQSQKELTDPNAYYLPRAERFQSEGILKAAVAEINTGLKAMPDEARLYAQRGLLRYEMVRGQGAKVSEVLQKGIREDAEIAGKNAAFAAESLYIVGLLEEELGNFSEAEKLFRSAIKTRAERKASIDDGGKYRIALGRILLRDRAPVIAVPVPPVEDKKGTDDKVGAVSAPDNLLVMHPWSTLIVSALIAQPGGEEVGEKEIMERLNETVKLAKELIASPNAKIKGQGYLLLGSAYSKQGRRTDGLKEYSKGLQLLYPGIETQEMSKMIEEHPAFQQPDSSGEPNPVMAERHFGDGMHFYWSKQYADAEAQFRQAVKYYKNDARYFYFLGLAQFGQGKRTLAINSIEEGARLEARTSATNPLAVRDINASLERIQGDLRAALNGYRYRASSEPDEPKKGK